MRVQKVTLSWSATGGIIDLNYVRDIAHLSRLSGAQAPSDGFAASSLSEGAFSRSVSG